MTSPWNMFAAAIGLNNPSAEKSSPIPSRSGVGRAFEWLSMMTLMTTLLFR
jgi:hypothetical protein